MAHICPWARDRLEYDGLCSHSALNELHAGDFSPSAKELEAQAFEIAQSLNDNIRRCRERAKNDNPAGYKANTNKTKRMSIENNPKKRRNPQTFYREGHKGKRHYSDVCKHAFTKKIYLTKHLTGSKHDVKAALLKMAAGNQRN